MPKLSYSFLSDFASYLIRSFRAFLFVLPTCNLHAIFYNLPYFLAFRTRLTFFPFLPAPNYDQSSLLGSLGALLGSGELFSDCDQSKQQNSVLSLRCSSRAFWMCGLMISSLSTFNRLARYLFLISWYFSLMALMYSSSLSLRKRASRGSHVCLMQPTQLTSTCSIPCHTRYRRYSRTKYVSWLNMIIAFKRHSFHFIQKLVQQNSHLTNTSSKGENQGYCRRREDGVRGEGDWQGGLLESMVSLLQQVYSSRNFSLAYHYCQFFQEVGYWRDQTARLMAGSLQVAGVVYYSGLAGYCVPNRDLYLSRKLFLSGKESPSFCSVRIFLTESCIFRQTSPIFLSSYRSNSSFLRSRSATIYSKSWLRSYKFSVFSRDCTLLLPTGVDGVLQESPACLSLIFCMQGYTKESAGLF